MLIVFFVLTRILFIASMVFIFGYVFGNFSKNRTLATITKVAAVLSLILFLTTNIFLFRARNWSNGYRHHHHYECYDEPRDSADRR